MPMTADAMRFPHPSRAGLEETTSFSKAGVGRLSEELSAVKAAYEAAQEAAGRRAVEVDGGLAQCKESVLLLKGHLDDQVGECNARLAEVRRRER